MEHLIWQYPLWAIIQNYLASFLADIEHKMIKIDKQQKLEDFQYEVFFEVNIFQENSKKITELFPKKSNALTWGDFAESEHDFSSGIMGYNFIFKNEPRKEIIFSLLFDDITGLYFEIIKSENMESTFNIDVGSQFALKDYKKVTGILEECKQKTKLLLK